MKGAWSLVSAAYQVARAQADLDTSVEALIDAMDDGCRLAKGYAPLNGRHSQTDSIVRDLLREVIKGASVVKVYCEKRPKSVSVTKACLILIFMTKPRLRRSFGPQDTRLQPCSGG